MESEVLAALARSNLATAAAILVVAAARPMLRRFVGARVTYAAWLVVPLAALASLLPARSVVTVIAHTAAATAPPAGQAPPTLTMAPSVATHMAPDWPGLLICVWLLGAAAALGVLFWRQHRFLAWIGPVRSDGQLLRARHSTVGPAVVGVFAPRILAPADFERRFSPREQEVVLAHERNHIAQGDPWINVAVLSWQCLNWFNPLVHAAALALRLDQEFACDAAVMARFPGARRSYAEAMLKAQTAAMALPLGCYWPAIATSALEQRLVLLQALPPSPRRHALGVAAATLLALLTCVAVWSAQPARRIVLQMSAASAAPSPAALLPPTERAAPEPVPVKTAVADDLAQRPQAAADAASISDRPPAPVEDYPRPPTTIDVRVRPDGWLPRLGPGVSIDMSISAALPAGKFVGEHVIYHQGDTYTSGSVDFDWRYLLVPGARQVDDKVEFYPALYLDGQLIGSGKVTVASGETAQVVLDNGQTVSVGAVLHGGADGPPRPG